MNTKPSDQDLDSTLDDVYDDAALGDDSWDDDGAIDDPKPRKKKGGLFNVIVIVLGVAAFGGIMFMRVASTPVQQQTAPQPDASAQQPQEVPVAQEQPTADPANAAQTGTDPLTPMPDFTATPDVAAPGTVATPDVAAAAPADTAVPDIDPTLATNVTDPSASPVLTPPPEVAMTPNDAVVPNPNPAPADQTTVPTIPTMATSPAAQPVATDTPAVTASPIDQGRLQVIEDKLNTLAAKMGEQQQSAAKPSAQSQAALTDVQAKLDTLMSRLDTLEAKIAAAPAVQKADPVKASPVETAPVEAMPEQDTQIDLGDADAQPTAEPVADAAPTPARVEVSKPKATNNRPKYVLRAVSKDKAYIASSKSAAVQGVAVGDNVPGWGTVRSITQGLNGRWQVVTDNGTIRQ